MCWGRPATSWLCVGPFLVHLSCHWSWVGFPMEPMLCYPLLLIYSVFERLFHSKEGQSLWTLKKFKNLHCTHEYAWSQPKKKKRKKCAPEQPPKTYVKSDMKLDQFCFLVCVAPQKVIHTRAPFPLPIQGGNVVVFLSCSSPKDVDMEWEGVVVPPRVESVASLDSTKLCVQHGYLASLKWANLMTLRTLSTDINKLFIHLFTYMRTDFFRLHHYIPK